MTSEPFGVTWVRVQLACGHTEYGTPISHSVLCRECKQVKKVTARAKETRLKIHG